MPSLVRRLRSVGQAARRARRRRSKRRDGCADSDREALACLLELVVEHHGHDVRGPGAVNMQDIALPLRIEHLPVELPPAARDLTVGIGRRAAIEHDVVVDARGGGHVGDDHGSRVCDLVGLGGAVHGALSAANGRLDVVAAAVAVGMLGIDARRVGAVTEVPLHAGDVAAAVGGAEIDGLRNHAARTAGDRRGDRRDLGAHGER